MKKLLVASLIASVLALSACADTADKIISDISDQLEDDPGVYYDPSCADDDGDGWCD